MMTGNAGLCSGIRAAGVLLGLLTACTAAIAPSPSAPLPALTVAQIVSRMEARNLEQAQALRHFSARRIYHLDYRGFPGPRQAEMVVEAEYSPATGKTFRILNESGTSGVLHNVLRRLLASEQEAQDERHAQQTSLSPANYNFTLVGTERGAQGDNYVLRVAPRTSNKYLYRGTIWVDAHDFAVSRMEVEPGRSPSFWTHNIRIDEHYARVGPFWLPASNQTETAIRLGGVANLTIAYQDYVVVRGHGDRAVRAAQATVLLPAPGGAVDLAD